MIEQLESRRLLAVTVGFSSGVLTVTGDATANHIHIGRNPAGQVVVRNGDTTIKMIAYADLKSIKASLLGGNDSIDIGPGVARPSTLNGGEGNDLLIGGEGKDSIVGESGNDDLRGNGANDSLFGGIGNDLLDGAQGADSMSGGDGNDSAIYAARRDGVKVTLDNVGNDGAPANPTHPAEGDNVKNDIERVVGGFGNDTLIAVGAPGNVVLDGRDGNDSLTGDSHNDSLYGGGGNDVIHGGQGNDSLYGGPGADKLFGDDGNDSFFAKDGIKDSVDGGGGSDKAQRDLNLDILTSIEAIIP